MKFKSAIMLLVGVAIGGLSVSGLNAQKKDAGAYAIVQFSDFGDPAAFKTNVGAPSPAVVQKHGGHFVARTDTVTVLRGENPPLTRYVIIGFDSVQQAKGWWDSDDWKPIRTYLEQKTKGRAFVVEAASQ
ncbi:MAG TPA: DUF1330 domain-containing protein [Xanthobacteraceae bacterium]